MTVTVRRIRFNNGAHAVTLANPNLRVNAVERLPNGD